MRGNSSVSGAGLIRHDMSTYLASLTHCPAPSHGQIKTIKCPDNCLDSLKYLSNIPNHKQSIEPYLQVRKNVIVHNVSLINVNLQIETCEIIKTSVEV